MRRHVLQEAGSLVLTQPPPHFVLPYDESGPAPCGSEAGTPNQLIENMIARCDGIDDAISKACSIGAEPPAPVVLEPVEPTPVLPTLPLPPAPDDVTVADAALTPGLSSPQADERLRATTRTARETDLVRRRSPRA